MTGAGATATGVGAGTRTHPAAPRPTPTARPTIASALRTALNGRMSLPLDRETTGRAGLIYSPLGRAFSLDVQRQAEAALDVQLPVDVVQMDLQRAFLDGQPPGD